MKVTVNEDRVIQLEEVFNSILLKTGSGEEMYICMRDSGFEFKYEGEWYCAKEGIVAPSNKSTMDDPFVKQKSIISKAIELIEQQGEMHAIKYFQDKIDKMGIPSNFIEICQQSAWEAAIMYIKGEIPYEKKEVPFEIDLKGWVDSNCQNPEKSGEYLCLLRWYMSRDYHYQILGYDKGKDCWDVSDSCEHILWSELPPSPFS